MRSMRRLGLALAALVVGAAADPFEDVRRGLVTAAACVTEGGSIAGGVREEAKCQESGGEWRQPFADADALGAACEATRRALEASGARGVVLVRVSDEPAFREGLGTAVLADMVYSTTGATLAIVEALPAQADALPGVDFVCVMPEALKISPVLEAMERAAAAESRTLERTVVLAPSSQFEAQSVADRWQSAHLGRRLLSEGREPAVRFEIPRGVGPARRGLGGAVHSRTMVISSDGPEASPDGLDAAMRQPELLFVQPRMHMRTSNRLAGQLMQGGQWSEEPDLAESLRPLWAAGVQGQGQIVGVADSGLDLTHCFFRNTTGEREQRWVQLMSNPEDPDRFVFNLRGRKVVQYTAFRDASDTPGGHGTHVAATIAGTPIGTTHGGTEVPMSSPLAEDQGIAPMAQLAFLDLGDSTDATAIAIPAELDKAFEVAYEAGARIYSNSWGVPSNTYSVEARQVDEYLFKKQDMLILFANGNTGFSSGGSVGSPATSKNALSVGASRGVDPAFNNGLLCSPECGVCQGGCENYVASFSSNGPTFDGRISPDVVAPGQSVRSAHASTQGCGTSAKSGTSMATPVIAGGATLARQFILEGRYPTGVKTPANRFEPMGALLKAIMVNSAQYLTQTYASIQLEGDSPDNYQGFGRVVLANMVRVDGNSESRSVYLDGSMERQPIMAEQGQRRTYSVNVPVGATTPLKATLAWYDAPASLTSTIALVNDLDLAIVSPSGKWYFANGGDDVDKINTVEQVLVPAPDLEAGNYRIIVRASAIRQSQQPYAVAFSGQYTGVVQQDSISNTLLGGAADPDFPGASSGSDTISLALIGSGIFMFVVGVGLAAYFFVMRRPRPNNATPYNPRHNQPHMLDRIAARRV